MKNYYRIMLGRKSAHAEECFHANFIGANFGIDQDLTSRLADERKIFNSALIPILHERHPEKSKIAAGLACASLYTIAKEIQKGDVVLCPNGMGSYLVGEVLDGYSYHVGQILPHRRTVRWYPQMIERSEMSIPLKNSAGSIGTISNISNYSEEIERLIAGKVPSTLVSTDKTVENPAAFAIEKHLEDFLVHNWQQTQLGKDYDIYQEEDEVGGRQYPTDTGPIDILAIRKDKKELLVIELKKGRASDAVVGQIQRYMGYVQEELAEDGQTVKGVIIALEDDRKIRRSLVVARNIEFYRYQVSFTLFKG